MENKESKEAIENLKKSILDKPEEILKRHSKSFRVWCIFRDFFAYWAGGLIVSGWLINIINGLRFSFTTGQWWKELIVMCGVGVVTGSGYILATAVKKHAAQLAVEANKDEQV